MDVISHGLWAAAAGIALGRRRRVSRRMLLATVVLGIAPDVVQMLPAVVYGATLPDPFAFLYSHVTATPGAEPEMPVAAQAWSHHLHCVLHSVVVAGAVTALVAWRWRAALPALAGWWLHIVLDVPTHSRDYYAVPLFYPFTYWGVDGIDWTTPWVIALNYAALVAAFAGLWLRRRRALE